MSEKKSNEQEEEFLSKIKLMNQMDGKSWTPRNPFTVKESTTLDLGGVLGTSKNDDTVLNPIQDAEFIEEESSCPSIHLMTGKLAGVLTLEEEKLWESKYANDFESLYRLEMLSTFVNGEDALEEKDALLDEGFSLLDDLPALPSDFWAAVDAQEENESSFFTEATEIPEILSAEPASYISTDEEALESSTSLAEPADKVVSFSSIEEVGLSEPCQEVHAQSTSHSYPWMSWVSSSVAVVACCVLLFMADLKGIRTSLLDSGVAGLSLMNAGEKKKTGVTGTSPFIRLKPSIVRAKSAKMSAETKRSLNQPVNLRASSQPLRKVEAIKKPSFPTSKLLPQVTMLFDMHLKREGRFQKINKEMQAKQGDELRFSFRNTLLEKSYLTIFLSSAKGNVDVLYPSRKSVYELPRSAKEKYILGGVLIVPEKQSERIYVCISKKEMSKDLFVKDLKKSLLRKRLEVIDTLNVPCFYQKSWLLRPNK